jgi:WD40 repeat protein
LDKNIIQLKNGYLASFSFNKIKIWNKDYKCIKILKCPEDCIISIIQLKNGYLTSFSKDNTVRIWN